MMRNCYLNNDEIISDDSIIVDAFNEHWSKIIKYISAYLNKI